ncbi:uncharacterized protein LOC143185990 [Calliopsis andreniformis]|uniref:uncharacterized protein LOC143185990 n=1 Tax=Calliopsis andreniformis TaxID=337506 RepID=UPI003FCC3BF2
MSFSKARIQRFNECENDVPAPGSYDPKFDVKVKGLVIEKSERFHDDRSIASAEYDESICTKSMSHVAASFRTPQLPRKKTPSRSCSKVKQCPRVSSGNKKLEYKSQHQLADLQVECSNKNVTIQEHEKHIEYMKEEVKKLESQLEDAHKKQAETEKQHKRDLETMATMQQEILNCYDEKHQVEIGRLRSQLLEVSEEKEREIQARIAAENDLKIQIEDFIKRIAALELELTNERHASKEKIHSLETEIEEFKIKLEKLTKNHKNEVTLLEQEKSELNSTIHNLTGALANCKEELKTVIIESNAKINAMIMEAKTTVENEMRLTTERYEACLVRVEMERAVLDKKLAQKDTEIAKLSTILETLKSSVETQESFGQSLQMELDRTETTLIEKKEELKALKDQIRSEATEMVARRKRFEVVMAENQASVAALVKRLMQNNVEVERLQHELEHGESCINEYRDLLNIMHNNSEMVHVQVHALMEELDAKKGLVNQLETESSGEIDSLKTVFEAKIEDLEKKAAEQLANLQADDDAKATQIVNMQNQLHKMANRINEMQDTLLKLEERNDHQELELSKMQLLNSRLNDQLKESNTAFDEVNELLEKQSAKYKVTLEKARFEIEELSDKIKYLQENKTDIEDKTELLEEERARREAAEEEVKKLIEYNEQLRKDHEEISEKYAELVGHQNHRQRIKHVSQLKDKINQLEQDMVLKARTIKQQQKIIEQLKAVERRVPGKEKENTLGLSKNVLSTPFCSPQKASTPLRSRNE